MGNTVREGSILRGRERQEAEMDMGRSISDNTYTSVDQKPWPSFWRGLPSPQYFAGTLSSFSSFRLLPFVLASRISSTRDGMAQRKPTSTVRPQASAPRSNRPVPPRLFPAAPKAIPLESLFDDDDDDLPNIIESDDFVIPRLPVKPKPARGRRRMTLSTPDRRTSASHRPLPAPRGKMMTIPPELLLRDSPVSGGSKGAKVMDQAKASTKRSMPTD